MVIIVLLVYLLIGIILVAVGPAKKSIAQAIADERRKRFVNEMKGRPSMSDGYLLLYRVILSLGTVLFWPVLLKGILQEQREKKLEKLQESLPVRKELRFDRMGGYGSVSCGQCDFSQKITSFTHGVKNGNDYGNSGYQCQTCGNFSSRGFEQPFADSDSDRPLQELPPKVRAGTIEFMQSMIHLCERQMQERPKSKWLPIWEPTVTTYRAALSEVSEEELASVKRVRDEAQAAYAASLFCECGGVLDREKVLFCPKCKCTNLSYKMEYMT